MNLLAISVMVLGRGTSAQLFRDELSERISPESCIFVLEKFDHPANEDCKQEEVRIESAFIIKIELKT